MTSIQWAELKARDLAGQQHFYRQLFGADPAVLRWREDPQSRVSAQAQPGLFHLAFLLPDQAALGGWLQQALAQGIRLEGASDHGVSQALYLSDPEGNGIEVYADRPASQWPGAPGPLEMYTRRLDLQELLDQARPWTAEEGLRLGHIHLRALDPRQGADWFEQLGMRPTVHYPGAEFYAADGYHHHFAVNNWGVGPAHQGNWTGLIGYGLRGPFADQTLSDPWGHRVELLSA